jgi:hypothetical protein
LTDSVALWAFPAIKLDQYCEQVTVLASANKKLTTFHGSQERRCRIRETTDGAAISRTAFVVIS